MSKDEAPSRLLSLDQFRGYTVLGMFVVNFVGSFREVPAWLKHHHTYCSYADTIMPQFLFAVGFAYRLTFLRRRAREGTGPAIRRTLLRCLGLILVGVLVYRLGRGVPSWSELTGGGFWPALSAGLKRDVFQALTHIGVTSLWVLPVIGLGVWPRVLYALASGVAFHLLSVWFYYVWVNTPPVGIDGGPLGFLTWSIPLLTGSLACDAFLGDSDGKTFRPTPAWGGLLVWSIVLMLLGYGLSCLNRITPPNTPAMHLSDKVDEAPTVPLSEILIEPPFVPPSKPVNIWTMSQRSGSVTYLTFSAGFSLLVLLIFWILCDKFGLRVGVFDTLGQNALVAYIIHDMVGDVIKPYAPRDCPLWYAMLALGLFLLICYTCLRYLQNQRIYLRL